MIPINKEKAYDRIQNQFMTFFKNLRKIGIKKNILNLKKSIYQKKNPTTNITLNDEKNHCSAPKTGEKATLI